MHKLVLMVLALTWIIGISVKERNSNDDDSSGDVPQPKSLNDVAGQNGKGKPSHPSFKLNLKQKLSQGRSPHLPSLQTLTYRLMDLVLTQHLML